MADYYNMLKSTNPLAVIALMRQGYFSVCNLAKGLSRTLLLWWNENKAAYCRTLGT